MDTDIIPLGERTLRAILDHVLAVGDEAESNYLEVKSSLDLASTEGVVKVAKFLLGAANRLPRDAERHFHGYAVLVIGAQRGHAGGIARGVEPHELEDKLRPYLGTQFPGFELGRLSVDTEHEVLFVVALPPEDGQPIAPCHKSFHAGKRQESVEDGAIYVRGKSNSRRAKSGEVLALVERARGKPKPPIDLGIKMLGTVSGVSRVSDVLEMLYEHEEEQFSTKRPATQSSILASVAPPSLLGSREPLTEEERAKRLEAWKKERTMHVEAGRSYFLGMALPGVGFEVISQDRFIAKPQLTITFHDCEAFDFRDSEDADYDRVVEPILGRRNHLGIDPGDYGPIVRDYPVAWSNRENDVEVTLTPDSFRPNVAWRTDQDDYVVVCRDPETSSVRLTWVLTEDGNDATTRGELEVAPGSVVDAGELFKSSFLDGAD